MENHHLYQQPAAYPNHHLDQLHQQQLEMFWSFQRYEIEHGNDIKNHQLPLARIKKIMKANENVQKISAEAPILFSKACDLFIQELTLLSWFHAEENKKRTVQKNDIAAVIAQNSIFNFLHIHEINEQATGLVAGGMEGSTASGVPNYYPQLDQSDVMMESGFPYYYPQLDQSDVMMGNGIPYHYPQLDQSDLTMGNGIPCHYPQLDQSDVAMGNGIPYYYPSVCVQPKLPPPQGWQYVWQSAEDDASGRNSGQGNIDGKS